MALRWPYRCKDTTSTTGTGTYTLNDSSLVSWRNLTRAVADGDLASLDEVCYMVIDSTVTGGPKLVEVCKGVWNNTTKTLTRGTIYQPGGAAVSWGAGTRDIFIVDNPVLFLLLAGGTMTGVLNILLGGTIITPAAETGLVVQRSTIASTEAGISIISGTTGKSKINMGDDADEDAGQWRYDNNLNAMVCRTNGSDRQVIDSAGVLKVTVSGNSYDAFAGGGATGLPFYQAAAPTGWTKSTANNDKALRVVSGTGGGTGGSRALSAASVGNFTLTIGTIPPHTHSPEASFSHFVGFGAGTIDLSAIGTDGGIATLTGSTGGGDPHTHDLALAYIDVIICTKN